MRGFAFFDRVSRAFHDYPSVPKVLVVVAVSGCGLVAYAEANPERKLASSAPVLTSAEVDNKKKKVVVRDGRTMGSMGSNDPTDSKKLR